MRSVRKSKELNISCETGQMPIKICFVGNTNNLCHIIARGFAERGFHVTHVIDRREILHRPEGRYSKVELNKFKNLEIVDIAPIRFRDAVLGFRKKKQIGAILRKSDAAIFTGFSPAILGLSHERSCFVLAGSDLTFATNWKTLLQGSRNPHFDFITGRPLLSLVLRLTSARQRKLIWEASAFVTHPRGQFIDGEKSLAEINPKGRRLDLRVIEVPKLSGPTRSDIAILRVFCSARLSWVAGKFDGRGSLDLKGVDTLLNGVRKFLDHGATGIQLVLTKKGPDLLETQELVKALGLDQFVVWLPELSQLEVFEEYLSADVVVDTLGPSTTGMAVLEALAMGKPVIARVNEDDPSPILRASGSDDVAYLLSRLLRDAEFRTQCSSRGVEFVRQICSVEQAVEQIWSSVS